jgi:hypothetical protein
VTLESKSRDSESLGLTIFVYIRPYIQANSECSSYKKSPTETINKIKKPRRKEGIFIGAGILISIP